MKFTKIVATISDKRCTPEFIQSLVKAGMNVVRINSAHVSPEVFAQMVHTIRQTNDRIAIMVDTKGPEIRTTVIADGAMDKLQFDKGELVNIVGDPTRPTTKETISVNYPYIAKCLHVGDHMLIDDGELDFEIVTNEGDRLVGKAMNQGRLGSRKSVNLPGISVDLPAVTERDRTFIKLADALEVDYIAHSFVRSAADIEAVNEAIDNPASPLRIIAKIENQEGIDNFDSILDACYGVMVARGDLGIEVPAERIPAIQRMMVDKCIRGHKPVIVATQMLHSMINSPRPTRAEVTDVAEAAYQRADALMLSGETASGMYPVEAVQTMARIAMEVERTRAEEPNDVPVLPDAQVTSFLARQAVMSEEKVGTMAVVTDAFHGRTARYVASFRGRRPVFAICNSLAVARRLALCYSIRPYYYKDYKPDTRYPIGALRQILADGRLQPSDRIAYLGSLGGLGATFLDIRSIGELVAQQGN